MVECLAVNQVILVRIEYTELQDSIQQLTKISLLMKQNRSLFFLCEVGVAITYHVVSMASAV